MANFLGNIVQEDGTYVVNIFDDGIKSFTFTKSDPNYNQLKLCVVENDAEKLLTMLDKPAFSLEEVAEELVTQHSGIEVANGTVYFRGKVMDNTVCRAIKRFHQEGIDYTPLVAFLENLVKNPSNNSLKQLYSFLQVMGCVITEDGCFLAYKTVKENYLDKYSGAYDNKPGAINQMPRNEVCDDPNAPCDTGFHVGALAYAGPGGTYHGLNDRVVIVKVNPADVVSVPKDHSCMKLRCCEYEVVADYQGELNRTCYSGEVCNEDYEPSAEEFLEELEESEFEEEAALTMDDMLVGWCYSFWDHLTGERRYAMVIQNEPYHEYIVCEMLYDDPESGDEATFEEGEIDDIQELDDV